MNARAYKYEDDSSSNDVELFEIAHRMKIALLPDNFISAAIKRHYFTKAWPIF